MLRVTTGALALLISTSAFAQTGLPPAPEGEPASPEVTAVERLRADFNARLVDFDARLNELTARIEALEAQVPGSDGASDATPAEASSTTTPAEASTEQD